MTPPSSRCPFGECDGSGFVVDEATRTARDCRCRPLQIARRRARALQARIPPLYQDASFDRYPLNMLDRATVDAVRGYIAALPERLAAGRGIWFYGATGTGKTTLAMMVAKAALGEGRSVAIYSLPQLLKTLRSAIGRDGPAFDLLDELARVELLVIDDFGSQYSTPWALEQIYLLVDGRYQNRQPIVTTSNLLPNELAEQLSRFHADGGEPTAQERDSLQLGRRIVSRLIEICGDPIWTGERDLRIQYRPLLKDEVP